MSNTPTLADKLLDALRAEDYALAANLIDDRTGYRPGWTVDQLRVAHAAYVRGERDDRTVEGHREWDRRRKSRGRREAALNLALARHREGAVA